MATTGIQDEQRLSPAIPRVLERLRRRIRSYVWLEGITSAIAWLGLAFWLSLAIDWLFEPSRAVRGVALGVVGLVLLLVLFRLILRRIVVRLTDGNMAMLLERRFPELDESLLTTVEVAGHRETAQPFSREMLAHTCREAERRVGVVRIARVFNPSPLVRSVTAAVVLAASIALFAVILPDAFGIWARRALGFSDQLWPRRTHLTVDGFDDGYVKVARGADREVVAKADLNWELVPDVVHIRYRTEEGARGEATMNRVGHEREVRQIVDVLEPRFRKMLQLQREVYDGTVPLEQISQAEGSHSDGVQASALGSKQVEIVVEADKVLALLHEDETAVALREATSQIREDMSKATSPIRDEMNQVVEHLGQTEVDWTATLHVQSHVIAALEETIKALQRARPDYQKYTYTFQGILSPIRFDLHGGDAWIEDLLIEVVENPTIVDLDLEYQYPEYTGISARTVEVTGVMQVPKGTEVTVVARANKDLVRVQVDSALEEKSSPQVIDLSGAADPASFRYTIPSLDKDTALLFTLLDTDGIKTREPVRLALAAVADEQPQLEVRLRGIGPAITPQARIPAAGTITDDYGIARIWFEYVIDKEKAQEAAIASLAEGPTEHKLDAAVEAVDLKVKPGQKLTIGVKAEDRYKYKVDDRYEGPNVGASERWLLDVVTPQQLRTMLESRELILRQRFEVIIREVEETRDLLARIQFGTSPSGAGGDNEDSADPKKKEDGKEGDAPPTGVEPGDKPDDRTTLSPEQIRSRAVMAAQRASQNASKNRHEILGVAEAFDEIREELINNRIDSAKLRSRLKDGIADPLRTIGRDMFPRLEQRLAELEATVADPQTGPRNRLLATQQIDLILVRMRQVLTQMIELETFNEAIAQLRAIIEAERKLNEATQKRHKDKLRDLLE